MNFNNIIESYFYGLKSGSYDQVISLFHAEAIIYSPLYGIKKATDFYKELFAVTNNSKIMLKNILISENSSNIAAAHFIYEWTLKNSEIIRFECVDIFEFSQNNQIIQLKIIYDTYPIRTTFSKLTND